MGAETLTESSTVSRWNISQDSIRCSSVKKSKVYCTDWGEIPEIFTGRIPFVSMFNDIFCGTEDNEEECLANVRLVSSYARRFGKGQWSFIGPGSEKMVLHQRRQSTRNLGQNCRKDVVGIRWEVTLKSKRRGKLSIHFAAVQETMHNCF